MCCSMVYLKTKTIQLRQTLKVSSDVLYWVNLDYGKNYFIKLIKLKYFEEFVHNH